ncbi:replicative DNA helicase [Anatilimnocola floriformis]|uniref:replicative DNA helicase n=1 Tax=Anatilimnocola floriformis TaxID=2948575 RepID=UPI0020C418AF|nr:DnaB-like helicase C-terminal domain-containing protein [Anatilimnocola floriformis]
MNKPTRQNDIRRQPPSDLQAEMGVLGSLMLMPEKFREIEVMIAPDDFFDEGHGAIFTAMKSIVARGRPLDPTLITDQLKASGTYDAVGGEFHLAKVLTAVPNAAHMEYYAEIVAAKSLSRRVIVETTQLLRAAYEDALEPSELVALMESATNRITSNRAGMELPISISQSARNLIASLRKSKDSVGGRSRAHFGILVLDERVGPIVAGEVCVIGARASSGKTAFATGILRHSAMMNRPSLLVSLEMTDLEVTSREATRSTGIDYRDIRGGQLQEEDYKKLDNFSRDTDGLPMFTWSPTRATTFAEIRSFIIHAQSKLGIGVVAIDYIGLISEPPKFRGSRREHLAECSRGMKRLAKELDIPVFLLCQLNREKERPNLTMLRECGAIEEDADSVLLIHRDEDDDSYRDLIVAKFRAGATGDIRLKWDGKRFDFSDPEEDKS